MGRWIEACDILLPLLFLLLPPLLLLLLLLFSSSPPPFDGGGRRSRSRVKWQESKLNVKSQKSDSFLCLWRTQKKHEKEDIFLSPSLKVWVPNQQLTLNKPPTELRCKKFANKHRPSMQIRRQRCKRRVRNVCTFRPSFHFCMPPLVVGWCRLLPNHFGCVSACASSRETKIRTWPKKKKLFSSLCLEELEERTLNIWFGEESREEERERERLENNGSCQICHGG